MSALDLVQDLLRHANARARKARDEAYEFEVRLIGYQASHRSLMAHLRMAAGDLKNLNPIMSKRYYEVADSWQKYVEQPAQSGSEAQSVEEPVSGHPRSTPGSPVETPVGVPQTVTWEGVTVPSIARRQAD